MRPQAECRRHIFIMFSNLNLRFRCLRLIIMLCILLEFEVESKESEGRCIHDIMGNSNLAADDPELIKYIQTYHLSAPSGRPYSRRILKSKDPNTYGQLTQKLLKGKRNGFFVEAGAHNGIAESKTLQLERKYNWTGLLIEPNSFTLSELRLSNRKSWVAGVCLSTEVYPQRVRFMNPVRQNPKGERYFTLGAYAEGAPCNGCRHSNLIYAGPVECFPLYSLLLAMNQTVIDYLSLDMEGVELSVLKNLPFDKLTIKVLSVEHQFIPGRRKALEPFLKSKGYVIQFRDKIELFAVHKSFIRQFGVKK